MHINDMYINVTVDSPMYDEHMDHRRGKVVKTVKEQCKKNHLLRIRIRGTEHSYSRQVFRYILAKMCIACGNAELVSLSECDWGRPAEYDEETCTLVDSICVPKDFDNLEMQKKEIVKMVHDIVKEVHVNKVTPAPLRL